MQLILRHSIHKVVNLTSSAIISGGFSRIVAGTVVAPFELVRTQMQSSPDEANMVSYTIISVSLSLSLE